MKYQGFFLIAQSSQERIYRGETNGMESKRTAGDH